MISWDPLEWIGEMNLNELVKHNVDDPMNLSGRS